MVSGLERPECEVIPLYVNSVELGGEQFIGRELAKLAQLDNVKGLRALNAVDIDVGDVSLEELHDANARQFIVERIARNVEGSVKVVDKMIGRKRRSDSQASAAGAPPPQTSWHKAPAVQGHLVRKNLPEEPFPRRTPAAIPIQPPVHNHPPPQ